MNRDTQEAQGNPTRGFGWVFYDGYCPICSRWVSRFTNALLRRRYLTAPLQRGWVQEQLALDADAVLTEMHVITADGTHLGGADALVFLAGRIWWGRPLGLLARFPGVMHLFAWTYRFVARHRHCGKGNCSIAHPPSLAAMRNDRQEPAHEADRAA